MMGKVRDEDFWLFNEKKRNERTVSCTPIMQVGDARKDGGSVVDREYLHKSWAALVSSMYAYISEDPYFKATYPVISGLLNFFIGDDVNSGKSDRNCCTVAFESLRAVNKNMLHPFDLDNINKRDFNFFGKGIVFGEDDVVFDYVEGVARLCGDVVRGVFRVVKNKFVEKKFNYNEKQNERGDNLMCEL